MTLVLALSVPACASPGDPAGPLESSAGLQPPHDGAPDEARDALHCSSIDAAPGPQTLAPLTRAEYRNTVLATLGFDVAIEAAEAWSLLPKEVRAPSRSTAMGQVMTVEHAQAFADIALRIAATIDIKPFTTCSSYGSNCENRFIRETGKLLFRRNLHREETLRFRSLFRVTEVEGDPFETGARLVLEAALQSPQFLHHLHDPDPLGNGLSDSIVGSGPIAIPAPSLASQLAYMVWQAPPDATLLEAATTGKLDEPEGIEQQVRRMARSPLAVAAAQEVVADWIDLDRLERNIEGLNSELKQRMVEQSATFVQHALFSEGGGFVGLLTTRDPSEDEVLAEHYGDGPRLGILTHGSFLAAHTNPDSPSTVSRGLFVLESVLCSHVPAPPATANTSSTELPDSAGERERSHERLSRGECGGCHGVIDPLAYALEPYDGAGRFRVQDEFGNATRADGWIPQSNPAATYNDLGEYLQALESLSSVRDCMVEIPVRFFLRRALGDNARDRCLIRRIGEKTALLGGSYEDLLVAVATDPAFTQMYVGENASEDP